MNTLVSEAEPETVASGKTLSIRVKPTNPNHHLWCNQGIWFIHYTIHQDGLLKQRIRRSLKTKNIEEARRQRDELFGPLQENLLVAETKNPPSGGPVGGF